MTTNMDTLESKRAATESTPLLCSTHASHKCASYPWLAQGTDSEDMTRSTESRVARIRIALLSSGGLCLLLIWFCALSSNVDAAWIVKLVIGQQSSARASHLASRSVSSTYAYQRMLANIGGASSTVGDNQVPNVETGAVIASPSTAHPDYLYSWVRDAALTIKVVISQPTLDRTLVTNYANAEYTHQQNAARSAAGQGEPKFNVDGSLFTGAWGRPQNDGAALRASALMAFAKRIGLNDSFTTGTLYKRELGSPSLIKTDLEYVAHHWQDSSFDLWEEVEGAHFFTLIVQWRSMVDGAKFASAINDAGAASYYDQQAAEMLVKLQSFWDADKGYVQAYQGVGNRDGIDCSVLLGSLKGWDTTDYNAAVNATLFGPASDKVLATHKKYVDAFRSMYAINGGAAAPAAVATGRYPSDVYDGDGTSQANPWYICTLAAAEVLNTALSIVRARGSLEITSTSLAFYRQFASSATTGSFSSTSDQYITLTTAIKRMADGFVQIVNQHAWHNGSLNEQFNRNTGFNQGARDLTWSYAAFVTNDWASHNMFLVT